MKITSWEEWREIIKERLPSFREMLSTSSLEINETLFLVCFPPIFESSNLPHVLDLISSEPLGLQFAERIWTLFETARGKPDSEKITRNLYKSTIKHVDEFRGADNTLYQLGILLFIDDYLSLEESLLLFSDVITSIKSLKVGSALRIQAELLVSQQELPIFNTGDSIKAFFLRQKAETDFTGYLDRIKSGFGNVFFERIFPGVKSDVYLEDIYIPLDIVDEPYIEQVPDQFANAKEDVFYRRNAIELLVTKPNLVLLGDPGSGKSTFAKNLSFRLAQYFDKDEITRGQNEPSISSSWLFGALLPIYVNLRSFSESPCFPIDEENASYKNLVCYVKNSFGRFGNIFVEYWEELEDQFPYQVMLIFDGYDEVGGQYQKRHILKKVIQDCSIKLKGTRILVTSRTQSYLRNDDLRLELDFHTALLAPLSLLQSQEYVYSWYKSTMGRESVMLLSVAEINRKANELAENLIRRVQALPHLQPLIQSPLFLTLLTLIHSSGKGSFPDGGRAELYEQTVRLLNRWDPPYERPSLVEKLEQLKLQRLRDALQLLAFNVHRDQDSAQDVSTISRLTLKRVLDYQQTRGWLGATTEAIIEYLSSRNGILLSPDEETFYFPHRSFQEFMAACALREQYDECQIKLPNEDSKEWVFPENISKLLENDFDKWRDVTVLLGARLVAQRSIDDFWELIGKLSEILSLKNLNINDQRIPELSRLGLLAGEIWYEHKLDPRANRHRDILDRIREILNTIMNNRQLTIFELNKAGIILSLIGDYRDGIGTDEQGIPDFVFRRLPATEFYMGNNEKPEEGPLHFAKIESPVDVSIFPVTVRQYNAFITADDGYRNPKWWKFSKESLDWFAKQDGSERLQGTPLNQLTDNGPVVQVNWFEAVAFCFWASKKLNATIRLPSEAEWEYAARGVDGRKFPWGNEFTPRFCNMIETGLGTPSTVGIFNEENPNQIFDMCGNVEEWCLTAWTEIAAYPYNPDDGRNDLLGNSPRVVRGGSFISQRSYLTTTSRPGSSIDRRTRYIGFRVVREVKNI